jgi:GLPGLI family protein
MTKAFLFTLLLLTAARQSDAQNNIFLSQGKIEFERKVNQFAQMEAVMDPDDESWTEFRKKMAGNQFKTDYFDLLFTRTKTLYHPGRESPDKPTQFFFQPPAQDNVIWSDLDQQRSVGQKHVFEMMFLVQDSLRTIKWKITDETRTIAGFTCRRANAIIMDSIYVVAFYTDEILTPGGPESFSGLPGMILGVALPHEHVTWFATKVEAVNVPEAGVAAPAKGKKVTEAGLKASVMELMKNWNKQGRQYMQNVLL